VSEQDAAAAWAQLRRVLRGLRGRRGLSPELAALLGGEPQLGRRHLALLQQVAAEGGRSVGDAARALGLSLPAASKLTRDLEQHGLVRRREHEEDRRRTLLDLDERNAAVVERWLAARRRPLERALASLEPAERAAFLKGLAALAEAVMEESPCGSVRPHHRGPARRGPHRDRPV
jgi:DNA-binding MarR family transcriptional regulator